MFTTLMMLAGMNNTKSMPVAQDDRAARKTAKEEARRNADSQKATNEFVSQMKAAFPFLNR